MYQKLAKMNHSLMIFLSGIWEYIEESRDMVHDLEQRTQKAKDNVVKLQGIMETWKVSLFERKGGKEVRKSFKICNFKNSSDHQSYEFL